MMKYLKLFENFRQEEIEEFMSIVREKVLELSDIGFKVKVEDKNSEPLLENMIRITIKRETSNVFKFFEVSDILADILLDNIEMGPLHKRTHVVVIPQWRENHQGERLSFIFSGDECIWSYENPQIIKMKSLSPINLDVKSVELFFE